MHRKFCDQLSSTSVSEKGLALDIGYYRVTTKTQARPSKEGRLAKSCHAH